MPKKDLLKKVYKNDLSGKGSKPFSFFTRPLILGIAAFIILAGLFSALIYQRYLLIKQAQKKEAYEIANNTKDKIQDILVNGLSAAKMLSFFVDKDGVVNNFDSAAAEILNANKDIDALQLVPGGVIKYVYPLNGNEKVIGYNILKDPARNTEAYKAIQKKELFFSGPYELRQGGFGVVGRLPVYRNDRFWGFSAVVIKMSTLLEASDVDSTGKNGYYFQLSKINPDTKKEEFFIRHENRPLRDYFVSVFVPNGEWRLSVEPAGNGKDLGNIWILAVIGFLFSVFGGVFVFIVVNRPEKLRKLVKEQTWQLQESEENYKILFEKSPLPLWIYDNETLKFLEVNDAALKLYGYSKDEFLQMDMLSIRREEDIPKFLEDNKTTTSGLREAGVWTHIKKNGRQVQVMIFSRNIFYKGRHGKLILLMDVTEKLEMENELVKNEEKYRSLIEQASDGIVITDLDGHILEVNKSICTMSGYGEEEMLGNHLYRFLPEDDIKSNPLRLNELMQGKALLYERRLQKKDGTYLDIEVNSRMASSHTLIGFIRDISERKRNEKTLLYQARLLESVSDAVTSLDKDRYIITWNRACEELYGFTTAEVFKKRIPQLVTYEFPGSGSEEVFAQVYREGAWRGEFNFIHPKTKQKTHLLSSINILKDTEGGVTGFIITSKDITERKRIEEEINKSNERFELITQATNDVIWDHDLVKNETWGNEKLYGLYGFEKGAAKIDFEMFLDRIHPDDRAGIKERMQLALERSDIAIAEEFRFKNAAGEYRNFYDRAYISYDEQGKPLRIVGAMQDITDREIIKKQILKEKELSDKIINSLPGIFYLFNQEGKFLRWNKNFEIVSGYSGEEISHMHPLNFFDEDEQALLSEKIANVFVAGEDNVEASFLLKNKQKIPYYFTGLGIEYEGEPCLMGVGLDFSEREKAAKLIRESEEKFRNIIEQASDGIFIAAPDAYFIDVNSTGCRMLGYTLEELRKIKFTDLVPAEDLVNNPIKITELEKGQTVINERRLLRKDGSYIDVEISAKVLFDGRYQSIVRDITERKKIDKALRESEERYRALVDNATEALVVMDVAKQKFVSVSDSATRLFSMTKEELLKVGPVELSPEYQPDGRPSAEASKDYVARAVNGEKPSFEWMHKDKNGKLIPCELWLVRLPSDSEVLIRGTIVDITERKKAEEELQHSEEKYRLLFYNNPMPMWMTTIPGLDIIDVNDAAIRQYGYSREEFLKLNTRNLRPAEDVEEFLRQVDKMEPGILNIRAWRHKKKDGTIIHVETYSHQIMYEGRPVWLGLTHDVTEKYKARELLEKSYEEIRQLASNLQSIREDERTNIAREIHDELGQQLTGLKMDMHWLSRRINKADEEVNKKMHDSIELINSTITTVRKIATDLRPSILDDLGLLAALEWQSEEFEKRSGVKVTFRNKAGDITVLPEAATALFRIYQELLTNIARHANAGSVQVSLVRDNKSLYFSIKDDGIGFNSDTIGRKKTLGLLGIRERTLLIGGAYEVKSKPGEGSEIVISIPLHLVKSSV